MKYRTLLRWMIKYRWSLLFDAALISWAIATQATFWQGLAVGSIAGLVQFAVERGGRHTT
jgi:hypothetical protein